MLATTLLFMFVIILAISIIVVITEGMKVTFVSIMAIFGIGWAYILLIWSSFKEFVITPALDTIFGGVPLNFYNISATMLFIAWVWVIIIAVINIISTYNRGSIRIYQNLTENKEDNI